MTTAALQRGEELQGQIASAQAMLSAWTYYTPQLENIHGGLQLSIDDMTTLKAAKAEYYNQQVTDLQAAFDALQANYVKS